jgi:hypothetical protein
MQHIPTQFRHVQPASRSRLSTGLPRDNAGRQLSVSFVPADDSLLGHPDEKQVAGSISFWRGSLARGGAKICFGCSGAFAAGRAPGAFLIAIGSTTDAAVGAMCVECFRTKTDVEIDTAAALMLRRVVGPNGRWLDPLPSQVR